MSDGGELTLDPENWSAFSRDAHRMLDDMLDHLATLCEQPVWQPVPPAVRERLSPDAPLPQGGASVAETYEQFVTDVVPYTSGNRHARAWGWVRGNGTPLAMMAEMLAAGIDAHVGGGNSAPVLVEEQVLGWLRRAFGMPEGTSGVLTSGASMANLLGLAVARYARLGQGLRAEGLASFPRCVIYGSRETHFWARKAVGLMGMGERSLRLLPVDSSYRVDLDALRSAIRTDRRAGWTPLAVIGNAGTVNTGAFDDLCALRMLCDEEQLWLHVDGAFGAWLKLVPKERALVAGLETADSLAFDFHKWGYQPFASGCVMVRDGEAHRAALRASAAYLEPEDRGPLAGGMSFADRSLEGSRPFAALKVWMALKTHGLRQMAAVIEQNVEQARYLVHCIERSDELCLLAPCVANVVCFAYQPDAELTLREINALQREIVLRVAESGRFLISGTTLDTQSGKRYALRIAITNHRTRSDDLSALLDEILGIGRTLTGKPHAV